MVWYVVEQWRWAFLDFSAFNFSEESLIFDPHVVPFDWQDPGESLLFATVLIVGWDIAHELLFPALKELRESFVF